MVVHSYGNWFVSNPLKRSNVYSVISQYRPNRWFLRRQSCACDELSAFSMVFSSAWWYDDWKAFWLAASMVESMASMVAQWDSELVV